MNDADFLRYAFRDNQAAIDFVRLIHDIAHLWDDLIDGDKDVSPAQINRAFFDALVGIPSNPFFRSCSDALLPVMAASCFNYQIANELQTTGDGESLAIAHVLRYSVADVLVHVAFLLGGHEWVTQVGPEIRRRAQRDTFENFLNEMRGKHEAA